MSAAPHATSTPPEAIPAMRALTAKQREFVLAYIGKAQGNATEAARLAGYDGDDNTLSSIGYENLRKPEIKRAIEEGLKAGTLTLEEVLYEITKIIRTTAGDFYDIDDDGQPALNMKKAKERGALGSIKRLRQTRDGFDLVFYDRLTAPIQLLHYYMKSEPSTVDEQTWREMKELSERTGINFECYFSSSSSIDN